jgi:tetratricopeptide (TPR) repeat protein
MHQKFQTFVPSISIIAVIVLLLLATRVLAEVPDANNQQASLSLKEGIELYKGGEYSKAIERLSQVELLTKDNKLLTDAYFYLSLCYFSLGETESAKQFIRKTIRTEPTKETSIAFGVYPPEYIELYKQVKSEVTGKAAEKETKGEEAGKSAQEVLPEVGPPLKKRGGLRLYLTGGLLYGLLSDYNDVVDGRNLYAQDALTNVSGLWEKMHMAVNIGGELAFFFSPNFGLGLGLNYSTFGKDNTISGDLLLWPSGHITFTSAFKPSLSVVPVTLNLHYLAPIVSKLNLDLSGGVGFYLVTFDLETHDAAETLKTDYTFKSSKGGIGLQAGLGLEMEASPNVAILLKATGRLASISGFMGEWTRVSNAIGNGSGSDYYIWYLTSNSYPWYDFGAVPPSNPAYSGVREFTLNLTGFSVVVGLKLSF